MGAIPRLLLFFDLSQSGKTPEQFADCKTDGIDLQQTDVNEKGAQWAPFERYTAYPGSIEHVIIASSNSQGTIVVDSPYIHRSVIINIGRSSSYKTGAGSGYGI